MHVILIRITRHPQSNQQELESLEREGGSMTPLLQLAPFHDFYYINIQGAT